MPSNEHTLNYQYSNYFTRFLSPKLKKITGQSSFPWFGGAKINTEISLKKCLEDR